MSIEFIFKYSLFAPGLAPSSLAAVHATTGGGGPSTAILLVHRWDDFSVSGRRLSDARDHRAAEVDDDDDVAPRRQVPSMAVAFRLDPRRITSRTVVKETPVARLPPLNVRSTTQ